MTDRKFNSIVDVDNGKTYSSFTSSDEHSSVTTVYGLGKSRHDDIFEGSGCSYDGPDSAGSILVKILVPVAVAALTLGLILLFLFICKWCA